MACIALRTRSSSSALFSPLHFKNIPFSLDIYSESRTQLKIAASQILSKGKNKMKEKAKQKGTCRREGYFLHRLWYTGFGCDLFWEKWAPAAIISHLLEESQETTVGSDVSREEGMDGGMEGWRDGGNTEGETESEYLNSDIILETDSWLTCCTSRTAALKSNGVKSDVLQQSSFVSRFNQSWISTRGREGGGKKKGVWRMRLK